MKLTLTAAEMLDLWRLRRALLPLREESVVERRDGIDFDRLLHAELRAWYSNLLDTAPVDMLVLTDIARDVAPALQADGRMTVTLPSGCRRVVEVEAEGWTRAATIAMAGSPLALQQDNPYSRGRVDAPVAVLHPGRLVLYSTPPGGGKPRLRRLLCVMEPEEGMYELDERAISLIPTPDIPIF